MKLTLLSRQDYTSMTLPEKRVGQYVVRGKNSDGRGIDVVAVEALRPDKTDGEPHWVMKSNRNFHILDKNGEILANAVLQPLELYWIQSADTKKNYTLYTEPLSLGRKQYRGYELTGDKTVLSIGREASSHICYANKFVSGHHAELIISANETSIRDLDSRNNTYVNGKAVGQKCLATGDVIYIMGLQIIVAGRRIFFNNPDGEVKVQSPELKEYHGRSIPLDRQTAEEEFEEILPEYYYRAPRFRHDVEEWELKVDAPPASQGNDEVPMIMMIGPSLTMGMASVASGAYTVAAALGSGNVGAAVPSMIMCTSMLFGTLMWPLVTKTYQKKLVKRKEARRQETYQEYLVRMEEMVVRETARQEQILRENDVDIAMCIKRIQAKTPQIWERTPKHTDFLSLRLGYGSLPLKAKITYPERRFMAEQDNLTEMMYQFGEKERLLSDVPICLPVAERFISGLYARRDDLVSYARGLILRIAALHSYDEVKLVLIYDESCEAEFGFTRWLPHVMDDGQTVRYIATNSEEVKELSAALDPIIEYRKERNENQLEEETPYYVMLCMDKGLVSKAECVHRILEHKKNLRFSVVSLYEKLTDLPKECTAVVELRGDGMGNLTLIDDVSEPPVPFHLDVMPQMDMDSITKVLANTVLETGFSGFQLPKRYTFMEMLNIGMVEHLNLLDNWSANNPTKSLAAVVGIDKYGEPFRLDLHQDAHGPHGLVAGMTGSGKSEFIISYLLSMAVSFHPQEVAFILIDYKGGGMAKSFEHIPHTAGVITNLDGNGIQRSLVSLRSELHRRERIFRDISQQHNISNIDIYKYQKLYREGKVGEPLPHLLIISDEFAELKKEQPDFMTELTSTARIGRSLGVHLVLATQKPGGVVDDQINSNSRFRVCLKVQDGADSVAMLGRPEAAALVDTGRFYLQVGYNEIFELGQSAWAGAPYYPSARVVKDKDDAVSVINTNGRVIAEANTDRFAMVKNPQKQLDVITAYISKVCEEEKIGRWKMWLDPIPALVYVDRLVKKYEEKCTGKFVLNPVAGEVDDPAHQAQGILRIPFTAEGNAIVYGSPGNGKAMFIEAVCYSLMREHTPDEVNIYIMDFGAETLAAFADAPQVGEVILSHETEKINNLFKLMLGKLETRKKLLSGFGGTLPQYNQQAENPEPNLLVIINNFAAFVELYEDRLAELGFLSREGTKYGISFLLACTGVNDVRFYLLQNFKLRYCLQLNNAEDYATVVGKTEGLLPEKQKGRGLFQPDEKSLLEFQTAHVTEEDPPYPFFRAFSRQMSERYSGKKAAGVPVLPEKVSGQFLLPHIREGRLDRMPVGVEKETLEIAYFDFSASAVSLVLSLNQEGKEFTEAFAGFAASFGKIKTFLLAPEGRTGHQGAQPAEYPTEYQGAQPAEYPSGYQDKSEEQTAGYLRVYSDASACAAAAREIYEIVLKRNNEYKDRLSDGGTLPDFAPLLVVIPSMSLLKTVLEGYRPEKPVVKEAADDTLLNRLQVAMEKCSREYHVYFVVAESAGLLMPFTAENWYKAQVNKNNGIWIGSGIHTQYHLNVGKKPAGYSAELASGFGFVIKGAAATLVKFLQ